MTLITAKPDRYISFCGMDCDGDASRMMSYINQAMEIGGNRWIPYFEEKLDEKAKMGHDDLCFIGSQMNNLRSFMKETGNEEGLSLLEHLEETFC